MSSSIGGPKKVIEVDETYIGGKVANRVFEGPPKKQAVVALVERGHRWKSHLRSDESLICLESNTIPGPLDREPIRL